MSSNGLSTILTVNYASVSYTHLDVYKRQGQSSFTMVNVTDGTNVTMGLCSVKFSFSHYLSPP